MSFLPKAQNDYLCSLLSESIDVSAARAERFIKAEIPDFANLALYGAGNMGKITLAKLRENGVEPRAFIDDTPSLDGAVVDGIPVMSRAKASSNLPGVTVVVTILNPALQFAQAKALLQSVGLNSTSIMTLGWAFPESFIGVINTAPPHHILRHLSDVLAALEIWTDIHSKDEFRRQLLWRLTLDHSYLPDPRLEDIYFPKDLNLELDRDTTFVDLGAYDGDTVNQFLNHMNGSYNEIIAVEPDPINFEKLNNNHSLLVANGRVVSHNFAVGETEGVLSFKSTGDMSATLDSLGETSVFVKPLRYFLPDYNGPVYVKFDIEGAEWETLTADADLITNKTPKMAISIYHDPKDLWRIPLLIARILPKSSLHLRSHGVDGTDLVMYAI